MKNLLALVLILYAQAAWSYTVSGNTYTTNGSQSDVQAACNAVTDGTGAVVTIPNGSYTWTGQLSITRSLTLQGQSIGGVTITNQDTTSHMINCAGSANGHIIVCNLNFSIVNAGIYVFTLNAARNISSNYTVIMHDCTFNNSAAYMYDVQFATNGIICWNCTFTGNGLMTGITSVCDTYGPTSSWNTPDSMGANDTTGLTNSYVENCTFNDASTGAVNMDDNTRIVFRYCTFNNAAPASHGQETSIYGVRHWEFYNNTFIYSSSGTGPSGQPYPLNMNYWIEIRGGTGVVTNNVMPDIPWGKSGIQLNVFSINRADSIACQIAYPAARQTGFGWSSSSQTPFGNPPVAIDGVGQISDPLYVWNNTGTETSDPNYVALNQYTPDDCGNGEAIGTFLQNGRDYFINVAKPGWTPYSYPHPLHTAYSSGNPTPTPNPTPVAPQNLRVTS
jgi:hypothetical protein